MKKFLFKILYIFTVIVMLFELGFAVKESLFTDIADLPVGTLASSVVSPSGDKTMNIYVVKNNFGKAVRGEIVSGDTKHNIFWQTGIDSVSSVWISETIVRINEIPLNADDTFGYDCRRGYSLFDEGSLQEDFIDIER